MEYKRQDIIDSIIKMRIEKGCSNKTILKEYLMGQLNYKQSYAYELLRDARKEISAIYKSDNSNALDEAVGQLESMYEDAIKWKNLKVALDIKKEIHKLVGLYAAEKIDLSIEFKAKFPGFNEDGK